MSTVTVTNQFLEENRTPNGAWTRAQFAALGIKWPPPHGWRQRIVGAEITYAQADEFIAGSGIYTERTLRKKEKMARRRNAVIAPERRVKACVNACDGIPTEFLESPYAKAVLAAAYELYVDRGKRVMVLGLGPGVGRLFHVEKQAKIVHASPPFAWAACCVIQV